MRIEIKLLLAKCCVSENEEILKFLHKENILEYVTVSLNPLLISQKVIRNSALFIESYSKMMKNSKELFKLAYDYGVTIRTDLLPFCIYPPDFIEEHLLDLNRYTNNIRVEYNDPNTKNNQSVIKSNHTGSEQCDSCALKQECPRFPLSYLEYLGTDEINSEVVKNYHNKVKMAHNTQLE